MRKWKPETASQFPNFLVSNLPISQFPDFSISRQRGFVLIWAAVGLLFFLGMAALVIDAAYLYLTQKQLSVSVDSGALGGATQIFNTTDCAPAPTPPPLSPPLNGACVLPYPPNCNARRQAQRFASYNKAGTGTGETTVNLDLNLSNEPNGDIILGNFNKSNSPRFTPCSPATDYTKYPTNAVRVTARRTGDSGTGIATNNRVSTFFAGVLNSDFKTSGVKASATAQKITRSSWPIAVPYCAIPAGSPCCPSGYTCSGTSHTLQFNPTGEQNACWTTFFESGGTDDIRNYLKYPPTIPCTGPTLPSQSLQLFNGVSAAALKDLEDLCELPPPQGHSCSDSNPWYIQLPVMDTGSCSPLSCDASIHPHIIGFVTLGITKVDATGTPKLITGDFLCDPNPPIGNAQCSALVE